MTFYCDNRNLQSSADLRISAIFDFRRFWQSAGMDVIDGNWIKARLSAKRGERKQLADALGIPSHMVTKVLKGERRVQPEEIPLVVAFFKSRGNQTRAEILADLVEQLPEDRQEMALDYVRYLAGQAGREADRPDHSRPAIEPSGE